MPHVIYNEAHDIEIAGDDAATRGMANGGMAAAHQRLTASRVAAKSEI